MDWTTGYVTEINYTHGYYGELNPLRIRPGFLAAGLAFPAVATACELGFGQGLSTNIHAAASRVSWWGTDFNPSQAALGQELGAISGARLFDEAFADFCARSDLPDFDFIALHGIWSWISEENRQVIADFARRKLKVGGVLYISYNTLPGWSTAAPLRQLMCEHKAHMGVSGAGIVSQIEGALGFTERLLDTNPIWLRANPLVQERFKALQSQNRNYLAHEYFNKDWQPMYFAEMAAALASAKLSFACSAYYPDHIDAINLLPEQQALLAEIPDANFRQTVRDYMVNQQFRRDYWVKGPRRLNPVERTDAVRQMSAILLCPRADVPLTAKSVQGQITMAEAVYNPVLDALADRQPHTLGELAEALQGEGIDLVQIEQAILFLVGQGYVAPVQDASAIEAARPVAQALNRKFIDKARGSGDLGALASPLTGGGIPLSRVQQLFLQALGAGQETPEEWAQTTWQCLSSQGQALVKDGKALATPRENLAELIVQAHAFRNTVLPLLKTLQIV